MFFYKYYNYRQIITSITYARRIRTVQIYYFCIKKPAGSPRVNVLYSSMDYRTDFFSVYGFYDTVFFMESKSYDRYLVFHTQRNRSRIHCLQALLDNVYIRYVVEFLSVGILAGIAVVYAVDILSKQKHLCVYLGSSECRACICAKMTTLPFSK